MATQQDLHQAFIDYGVSYLNETDTTEVDPKIFESIYKYLDKKEFDSVSKPQDGSFEGKAFDKIKAQHGVE